MSAGVEYLISVGYFSTTGGTGNFRLVVNSIGNSATSLPVELVSFDGKMYNDDVALEWTTASENNSDYFIIERSTDGSSWSKISELDAAGNSTQILNYITFDENPPRGIVYYRLKQYDFDGQNETFGPISVNIFDNSDCDFTFYNLSGQLIDIQKVPAGVYLKKCKDTITKFVKL